MFKDFGKKAVVAAGLAAATLTVSTSADARGRYYRHHGGNDAAVAVGAGILGLAVGAAIASDRGDRYDRRYRDYPDQVYYNGYPRTYYNYDNYPRNRMYRGYPRNYHQRGWNHDRYDRNHDYRDYRYDRYGRGGYRGW